MINQLNLSLRPIIVQLHLQNRLNASILRKDLPPELLLILSNIIIMIKYIKRITTKG